MKINRRQLRKLINEALMQESFTSWLASVLPSSGGMRGNVSNTNEQKATKGAKKINNAIEKGTASTGSKKGTGQDAKTGYYIKVTGYDADAKKAIKKLNLGTVKENTKENWLFIDPK